MNKIAKDDPNGKINHKNYKIEKENDDLIKMIDHSVGRDFYILSNFLKKDAKAALDLFFKNMDTEKLEKEFEFVKQNLDNENLHLVYNYYPFIHLS